MIDVAIVGAGFGGLGMAIELKRNGFESFVIIEKASDVGGTWRDNVYPGCACDIPSALYSFSFARNPDWSRRFPPQTELWDYLKRCADRYGLRPYIRFDTELDEARYDEAGAIWKLTTTAGETIDCRVLVCAMGALSRPSLATLPGGERFGGRTFHSGRWDSSYDLRGKRVAVVGTGASAIQIVPAIAPLVERLAVFQRTPPWVIPRGDAPVPRWHRGLMARLPVYGRLVRALVYARLELQALGFAVNPALLGVAERIARRHLERQVRDPALRRKLSPEYRLGCKRVLISDDYYPALQRPNVELVTEPIARVDETGIVTADGRSRAFDAIVYATGFTATQGTVPVRVYGRGGIEINDAWRGGMEAYLGTSVAGFPNVFTIVGPNTGLGHNSMILMMEAQFRYVVDALRLMRRRGARSIDVRSDVQRSFNARLQERMKRTVWATGCTSWYLDATGKNTTLWPGFTFVFRALTRRVRPERYELR